MACFCPFPTVSIAHTVDPVDVAEVADSADVTERHRRLIREYC
jgi:hypothetical protein